MTLMAHAADGLVLTSYRGLNASNGERHIKLLVGVWVVAALLVHVYGSALARRLSTAPQVC